MSIDWQTVVALLCVAAAAVSVGWRVRGWLVGSANIGCGSACKSCPANQQPQQLVQIQLKK